VAVASEVLKIDPALRPPTFFEAFLANKKAKSFIGRQKK
jgi:hypothetical protein